MFDLRAALVTAITNLNIAYVTTSVFDAENSELAIADLEKKVFEDSAVLIGDWLHPSEAYTRSWNVVSNTIELFVCAKSATAKTALNDTINALKVGLLRNSLDVYWLTTDISEVAPVEYSDNRRVQFRRVILEIRALETATAAETNTHRPTISIVTPTANEEVGIDSATDFVITTTYSVGDYPISAIYYMVQRQEIDKFGQASFVGINTTIAGGTDSYTWGTPDTTIIPSPDTYIITVIIIDAGGKSNTATRTITILNV